MKTNTFLDRCGILLVAAGLCFEAQAADENHSFTNLNRLVPDGNLAGLSDTHSVTSTIVTISSLRVRLHVQGEFNGDLYGYVRHVNSDVTNFCILLNRPGRATASSFGYPDAGLNVVFDDLASNGDFHGYRSVVTPPPNLPVTGAWQPDGRNVDPTLVTTAALRTTTLGSFAGANASGEWTLYLVDAHSGATNLLKSWELEFTGATRAPVAWSTPADIVYGTPLGAEQLNGVSPIAGSFVYDPPTGTVLNAGMGQTLSVTFTPDDTTNYVVVTTNVIINVLPKPLTIIASNRAKTYGETVTFDTTPPSSDFIVVGLTNSDAVTSVTLISAGAAASAPVAGSPSEITVGFAVGTGLENYAIGYTNGSLTIAPAGTTSSISSSANPAATGTLVSFTFQATPEPPGAGIPTGDVQFRINGTNTGPPVTLINAVATYSLATLPAGLHTVAAAYAGDGNFIGSTNALIQRVNTVPVAGTDTIEWSLTNGVKVSIATLLSNDFDADGDSIELISVNSVGTNNGNVTLDGGWVYYTPPSGSTNADAFTYTIADSHNFTATGSVLVQFRVDSVPAPNLVVVDLGNGSFQVQFNGIPGLTYRIEYSGTLNPPDWQPLGNATADAFGRFVYTDTPPGSAPQRYYRSAYP